MTVGTDVEALDAVSPTASSSRWVTLYHKKRWTLGELEARDFDPASPEPPITLFDVQLDSEIFVRRNGSPWERVLLRKETTW